ncbi:cationic peroxidase 1 [Fagus crenata]
MAPSHSIPSILTSIKFCLLFSLLVGMGSAQLSSTFYAKSCPNAVSTIKSAVDSAVSSEARMGASLLRLHFHDCFGCDASILLDDTSNVTGEKNVGPNNSLRGYEVIDTIKSQLEKLCPGVVSCADILTVAARDSVVALSGPSWSWPVDLGRRDSTTASSTAVGPNIPSPALNLGGLISAFSKKGFTAKEMVALSGSHTIGQARCASFRTRIYNETNIDSSFAASLKSNCPSTGGGANLAPLDVSSPTSFDNAYFNNLVSKKGLLHSDQQLFSGGSTDSIVNAYSSNSNSFRIDFANAMVKMGKLSLLTGTSGQIRTNCRKAN